MLIDLHPCFSRAIDTKRVIVRSPNLLVNLPTAPDDHRLGVLACREFGERAAGRVEDRKFVGRRSNLGRNRRQLVYRLGLSRRHGRQRDAESTSLSRRYRVTAATFTMMVVVPPVTQAQLEMTLRVALPGHVDLETRTGGLVGVQHIGEFAPVGLVVAAFKQVVDQRVAVPAPVGALVQVPTMVQVVPAVGHLRAGRPVVLRQWVDQLERIDLERLGHREGQIAVILVSVDATFRIVTHDALVVRLGGAGPVCAEGEVQFLALLGDIERIGQIAHQRKHAVSRPGSDGRPKPRVVNGPTTRLKLNAALKQGPGSIAGRLEIATDRLVAIKQDRCRTVLLETEVRPMVRVRRDFRSDTARVELTDDDLAAPDGQAHAATSVRRTAVHVVQHLIAVERHHEARPARDDLQPVRLADFDSTRDQLQELAERVPKRQFASMA